MRIALVSTCALPTPPHGYGGTERVVGELAEGLVELGHDVLVYATGDSSPAGTLRWLEQKAVWPPTAAATTRHVRFAFEDLRAQRFVDVVHLHDTAGLDDHHLVDAPCVLTLHQSRRDTDIERCRAHPDVALVAISRDQGERLPEVDVARVIHHGIDTARYPIGTGAGGYLAFVGRLTAEKAPHVAIDAATAAGVPIHLAGESQDRARGYFETEVLPRLSRHGSLAHWRGELFEDAKIEFLRNARALLFPIQWDEPFGLVMIEAMIVGTPVIAFPRASVCELVEDGVTGLIVRDVHEMSAAIRAVDRLDRARCSARARKRFSRERMTRDYLGLYEDLAATRRPPSWRARCFSL